MSNFADDFGANQWLVDEMFEKFKQDPNSVDKTWWEFFKDYSPQTPTGKPISNGTSNGISNGTSNGSSNVNGASNGLGALASAPKGGNPPVPKSQNVSESPISKSVPVAPTQVSSGQVTPAVTPAAPTQAPTQTTSQTTKSAPVNPTAPRISPTATPADPVVKPIPTLVTPGRSEEHTSELQSH